MAQEKVQYYDIATEKRAEFDRAMADYIKRKVFTPNYLLSFLAYFKISMFSFGYYILHHSCRKAGKIQSPRTQTLSMTNDSVIYVNCRCFKTKQLGTWVVGCILMHGTCWMPWPSELHVCKLYSFVSAYEINSVVLLFLFTLWNCDAYCNSSCCYFKFTVFYKQYHFPDLFPSKRSLHSELYLLVALVIVCEMSRTKATLVKLVFLWYITARIDLLLYN